MRIKKTLNLYNHIQHTSIHDNMTWHDMTTCRLPPSAKGAAWDPCLPPGASCPGWRGGGATAVGAAVAALVTSTQVTLNIASQHPAVIAILLSESWICYGFDYYPNIQWNQKEQICWGILEHLGTVLKHLISLIYKGWKSKELMKNPAYGTQSISRPMGIVAPIP